MAADHGLELVRKRGCQVLYGVTPPTSNSRHGTAGQNIGLGAGSMGLGGDGSATVTQPRSARSSWYLSRADGPSTPGPATASATTAHGADASTPTVPSIPSPGPVVSLEEAAAAVAVAAAIPPPLTPPLVPPTTSSGFAATEWDREAVVAGAVSYTHLTLPTKA